MKKLLIGVSLVSLFSSCAKTEGEGGNAKIQGKIFAIDYPDKNSSVLDTFPASEEDVYIIYGDNEAVDNKEVTNQDGLFCFDYLRKGTYTIVVYTKDPEKGDIKFPVEKTIEIKERKGEYTVDDIYIYKSSYGVCSVSGKVKAVNFANDEAIKPDTTVGCSEDVYISASGSTETLYKQTTAKDGSFAFNFLKHGKYTVTAYTRDPDNGGAKIPVSYDVEIKDGSATASTPDFYLYKSEDGYATITGALYAKDYSGTTTTIKDEYYLVGEDVFIRKKGSSVEIDKVQSIANGVFVFTRLPKGTYEIYSISKIVSTELDEESVKTNLVISTTGQDLDAGTLIINK